VKLRSGSIKKSLSLAAGIIVVVVMLTGGVFAEVDPIERLSGQDRYETAARIAERVYDQADTVIIARGDAAGGYADGLAGNVLSGALDAPVLLTSPEFIPVATAEAVETLGASRAIILGGESAVSAGVESGLGIETVRVAGETREETAAKIAEMAAGETSLAGFAFIVNSTAPADSLVVGPIAAAQNVPVLQVQANYIPETTREAIKALGINELVVVGGSGVVSHEVYSELGNLASVERVSGQDRYETSVAVAERFYDTAANFIFAGGSDARLSDALAGGYLGAAYDAPVLYVSYTMTSSVENYFSRAVNTRVFILGGTAAVTAEMQKLISDMIQPAVDLEIEKVEPLTGKRDWIRVYFNAPVTEINPADISIINTETMTLRIVDEVRISTVGAHADLKILTASGVPEGLEALTDYELEIVANSQTLVTEFVFGEYLRGVIFGVDSSERTIDVDGEEGNAALEIPENMEVDFEWLLGREMRLWYNADDVVTKKIEGDYTLWVDAVEVKYDDEIILVSADDEIDIEDAEEVEIRLNGKSVDLEDDLDGKEFDYAKITVDSKDRLFVDAYLWDDFVVVKKVDDDILYCAGGEELDIEDYVIIKDGETFAGSNLEEGDILFYNDRAENSTGEKGYAEVYNSTVVGEIERVFSDAVEMEDEDFEYKGTRIGDGYARYLEDGKLKEFNADAAEQMKEAGEPVTFFFDRGGELIYAAGELEMLPTTTYPMILQEDLEFFIHRNRGEIDVVARSLVDDVDKTVQLNRLDIIKVDTGEFETGKQLPDDLDTDEGEYMKDVYYCGEEEGWLIEWEPGDLEIDYFEFGKTLQGNGYRNAVSGEIDDITDSYTIYAVSEEDEHGEVFALPLLAFDHDSNYGELLQRRLGGSDTAREEAEVFYMIRNDRGDIKGLGFAFLGRLPAQPFDIDDRYVKVDWTYPVERETYKRLKADTVVYDIQHGDGKVEDDLEIYYWGEVENMNFDRVIKAEVYHSQGDVVVLVIKDSDYDPDTTYYSAVIDSVRKDTDGNIIRVDAWVEGEKERFWVAEGEKENADVTSAQSVAKGEPVILETGDYTDRIYRFRDFSAAGKKLTGEMVLEEVKVADGKITADGVEYILVEDYCIYDIRDKDDIESIRLRNLDQNDSVYIVLDREGTRYAEIILLVE